MDFTLVIPHTPWIPERVDSLNRLFQELSDNPGTIRIFDEKCPNWKWSRDVWEWGAQMEAPYLVQIQDDVRVAPNFWQALTAMVTAVPDQIIGLQGAHEVFRTLSREGHRWATSQAWLVGVGYVIPRTILAELVAYRAALQPLAYENTNEDEIIAHFCMLTKRDVWHPIPTIIDHDTTIPSTYANDNHKFRRATVTWREFGPNELSTVDFWTPRGLPPVISNPHLNRCWGCQLRPASVGFQNTACVLCRSCVASSAASLIEGPKK